MILGEMEFTGYQDADGTLGKRGRRHGNEPTAAGVPARRARPSTPFASPRRAGGEAGRKLRAQEPIPHPRREPRLQDVEEPRQRGQPRPGGRRIRGRFAAAVRDVHGPAGSREALEHGRRERRARLSGPRLADDRRRSGRNVGSSTRPCRTSSRTAEQNRVLHKTIQAVTHDLEQLSFNTAIARMMEFTNFFIKDEVRPRVGDGAARAAAVALCPAPGRGAVAALGHANTLAYEPWPGYDEPLIREDTIEIPVQVNGKLRSRVVVPAGAGRRGRSRPRGPTRESPNCWPARRG